MVITNISHITYGPPLTDVILAASYQVTPGSDKAGVVISVSMNRDTNGKPLVRVHQDGLEFLTPDQIRHLPPLPDGLRYCFSMSGKLCTAQWALPQAYRDILIACDFINLELADDLKRRFEAEARR